MPNTVLAPQLETAVASPNGNETTPVPTPQTSSPEVFALFKAETTVMVWLTFLIFGGGLLALYYARVRYLPNIEWNAALIYLGTATIIGGGVGLLFAMSLFLPGFIWSESLIFDPRLENAFCFDKNHKELCVGTIFGHFGRPFGWALLLSHIALVVGYAYSLNALLLFYAAVSLSLIALICPYMQSTFTYLESRSQRQPEQQTTLTDDPKQKATEQAQKDAAEKNYEHARWNLKCVFWFVVSLILSQISIATMYVLSKPKDFLSFFSLTVICTAGCLLSTHVVALLYHRHSRRAILASLVAAGCLLLTADWFSPLSLRIMGYYGLGGDRKGDLIVTDDGSKLVEDLGFTLCRTRTVCGVEILSKLGDEYYLVVDGKTFTLPKSAVQSYQSSDPRLAK